MQDGASRSCESHFIGRDPIIVSKATPPLDLLFRPISVQTAVQARRDRYPVEFGA
jgi:hypothetical protein